MNEIMNNRSVFVELHFTCRYCKCKTKGLFVYGVPIDAKDLQCDSCVLEQAQELEYKRFREQELQHESKLLDKDKVRGSE